MSPMHNRRRVPSTAAGGTLPDEYVLLDVREPHEWEAGHAPDSWFCPLRELESVRFQLPMNRTIAVICRSGHRSVDAVVKLQDWGFQAVNVAGGLLEWKAAGKAVVTDAGTPGTVA